MPAGAASTGSPAEQQALVSRRAGAAKSMLQGRREGSVCLWGWGASWVFVKPWSTDPLPGEWRGLSPAIPAPAHTRTHTSAHSQTFLQESQPANTGNWYFFSSQDCKGREYEHTLLVGSLWTKSLLREREFWGSFPTVTLNLLTAFRSHIQALADCLHFKNKIEFLF